MIAALTVDAGTTPPREWHDLAQRSESFYADPRWITGITTFFRFPLVCLTARRDGVALGALALARVPALLGSARLVSLPFSYAGGVIGSAEESAEALYTAARQLALDTGVGRVEIKQRRSDVAVPPGFERHEHYAAYRVPNAGQDEIWNRLHESTQRSIRKAEKSGVVVARGSDHDDWLAMATLQEGTSRRHGVPPPPRAFFTMFCRDLQREGLSDLYLARVPDGRIGAGAVIWKGRAEWIQAFGASDRSMLEYRPNHALLWTAMRDAAALGVPFDLGRAAEEQEGLVEFKLRWGGQATPLAYDYWPSAGGLNVRRRDRGLLGAAARVWSLLPSPLARLGAPLYRYLG